MPEWSTDLPFDKYHQFIASLGAVAILAALFLDSTFIGNRVIFEMGAGAVFFGLIAWVFESLLVEYTATKSLSDPNYAANAHTSAMGVVRIATAVRILIIIVWLAVETLLYTGR